MKVLTASVQTCEKSPTKARARPEVLAPAGDRDCLRAAVENGADAVYFGLKDHNARARATNFDLDGLPEIIHFLHRCGVKGYVALNTLVFPKELDSIEPVVARVAEAGADAIIVQDLGLIRLARAICPELPIHASTQMTLTSAESIRLVEELGVARVILARELSLDEIRRIRRQTRTPLEVFVHGALCVAYSGQCLTSEALGGRSANRGQCAQACRLPYELVCDGERKDLGEVQYLLSPQDLAAYDLIPELVELGMAGLKIEGRLKTPEYVANITRHYRLAVDGAVAGRPVVFDRRQIDEMELSFSRGFSVGWLHGNNHKVLVAGRNPRKHGLFVGDVRGVRRGRVLVQLAGPLKRGDGIVFDRGRPEEPEQGGRVYEIFRKAESVIGSVSTGLVELTFGSGVVNLDEIHSGNRVWKTDDPELTRRLRKSFSGSRPLRRVPLDVTVTAHTGELLRVEARAENGAVTHVESAEILASANRHPCTIRLLREQLGRLGASVYSLRSLEADIQGEPMVPLSVLGKLRHDLIRQLDCASELPSTRTICSPAALAALRAEINFPRDDGRRCKISPTTFQMMSQKAEPSAPGTQYSVQGTQYPERSNQYSDVGEAKLNPPMLHVLCRNLAQLEHVLAAGASHVYADFQDIRDYARAVSMSHAARCEIFLATPRIQKPAEGPLFKHILRHGADGILVRNLGGFIFFTERQVPVVADFSLNAANELAVQFLRERGADRVTASYDLNAEQLGDLVSAVPPDWLEIVIHQHMPMFHMEHCVFCAVLSPGTDRTNCGRPCDHHEVKLLDRVGMEHPLKADVGCRNTLFNAVPQSAAEHVAHLLVLGVRHFRIELLNDTESQFRQVISGYRELISGRLNGREVWTRLKALNRVGVTRGALEN